MQQSAWTCANYARCARKWHSMGSLRRLTLLAAHIMLFEVRCVKKIHTYTVLVFLSRCLLRVRACICVHDVVFSPIPLESQDFWGNFLKVISSL